MYTYLSRSLVSQYLARTSSIRFINAAPLVGKPLDQFEYLKSALENETKQIDWSAIKSKILSLRGKMNQKNIDGVLLKKMTTLKNFDAAISFVKYLNKSNEIALGSINGVLILYYEISKTRNLTAEERKYIQDSYKYLYEKYKLLDYSTCEKLLRALCVIDEYEKAMKVLDDIKMSAVPSHPAYSILIGTLFRNKKKKLAFQIIQESISDKRPLLYYAYENWINYVLQSYKVNKTIIKYLEEILVHISSTYAVIDEQTAVKLKETYEKLDWEVEFTKIRKVNGQCIKCRQQLDCLHLSQNEFETLQKNVKDKLIIGSDLFLKSSPKELEKFLQFVEKTGPYDIVIDALNIAYSVANKSSVNKLHLVATVVSYFKEQNKKILLLGRNHMLRWNKGVLQELGRDACCFFIDNLSQDDPYFITAAILSGPKTDIVSKDLLRTHQFQMKEEYLLNLFKRWQWQHQWMVFTTYKGPKIQPPLTFTPCAQKRVGWHLPYKQMEIKEEIPATVNDGIPDLSCWLCIRPKTKIQININKILE